MRRWLLTTILAFWCAPTLAAISVTGLGNVNLGTWDPSSGPISTPTHFCVASTSGASGNLRDYQVQLDQLAAVTPFELVNLSSSSDVIAMAVTFVDNQTGSPDPLTPGVPTLRDKTGVANCPGSTNAQFLFDITVANLSSAPAGTYRGGFTATFRNNNGSGTSTVNFDVDLVIPEMIRISNLDDIDLGSFDGASDLTGTDGLCVYRNNALATYTVSASGASGAFELGNGVDVIPYEVEYDDGNGFTTLLDSTPAAMANADSNAIDCSASTVATLRITTRSGVMSGVSTGVYADTLTLTVAPI